MERGLFVKHIILLGIGHAKKWNRPSIRPARDESQRSPVACMLFANPQENPVDEISNHVCVF